MRELILTNFQVGGMPLRQWFARADMALASQPYTAPLTSDFREIKGAIKHQCFQLAEMRLRLRMQRHPSTLETHDVYFEGNRVAPEMELLLNLALWQARAVKLLGDQAPPPLDLGNVMDLAGSLYKAVEAAKEQLDEARRNEAAYLRD